MSPTGTECAVDCMHASNLIEMDRLSLNWQDNNAMHAKSGLRVVLEWKIYRPDSVIAAVIRLEV